MPHLARFLLLFFWPFRQTRCLLCIVALLAVVFTHQAEAQKKRRPPGGGRTAIVIDERLAVLRDDPGFGAGIIRRLGRGRAVSVRGARKIREVTFLRVGVTRRTSGWIQSDAVASLTSKSDDRRLLRLIDGSEGFDKIDRASIFLEVFPRSQLRPTVLLILGEAAEREAAALSRSAERRLDRREMIAGGAPAHSYFLNFNGLDRFRKRGIIFDFDSAAKRFRYNGASWREIIKRYPKSPEAAEARQRLESLRASVSKE